MATVNWNKIADKTPPVQGGLSGGDNHIGHSVPGVFRLSDLPTSGTSGPKLKIPAGTIPTAWSLYLLKNNLAEGKTAALTFKQGANTLATGTVAGVKPDASASASASASGASGADATAPGLLNQGKIASPALVTSDEEFVVPTVGAAITPETDGDALVVLFVNVEVVDRSKVYLY